MKKILLAFLLSSLSLGLFAQIKNDSFEIKLDANQNLPANWGFKLVEGYNIGIDNQEKHSGNSSFKIIGTDKVSPKNFQSFSQSIPYETARLKKIMITGYVKTNNVRGNVAFWCQVWDKNNKMIGFENIGMQQGFISGTGDWKKYALNLTLSKDVKNLFFGVYLAGTGTSWFDDFKIEEVEMSSVPPTEEVVKYIKEFKDIIKENSIYKDSLNWTDIDEDIQELSKGLKTTDDARVLTAYVLQRLNKAGDHHSFFQNKTNAQGYANSNINPQKVVSKLLDNDIAYISVPGFGSLNQELMDAFANDIQLQIKKLDTENTIKGWVIDLRGNTGGNMYPMIAGLGPLAGGGQLGYFVKTGQKGKDFNAWSYSKKGEKISSTLGIKIKESYRLKLPDSKIAVLIGPSTASSGEMTAISFIGKENTKLFGEPTAGLTSANKGFKLSDGAYLYLAVSYTADRNKKEYKSKIEPDVFVKKVQGSDAVLKSAESWLLGK